MTGRCCHSQPPLLSSPEVSFCGLSGGVPRRLLEWSQKFLCLMFELVQRLTCCLWSLMLSPSHRVDIICCLDTGSVLLDSLSLLKTVTSLIYL